MDGALCEKGKEAVGPLEEGEGEKIEVHLLKTSSGGRRIGLPYCLLHLSSLEIKRESPGVVVWLEMSDCWQAGNTKLYNLV